MVRVTIALAVLAVAGLAGWIVYALTDSETAFYIVSAAGAAVGLAALVISMLRQRSGISSTVKVRTAKNSTIKGVSYSDTDSEPSIKSKLEINDIEGGNATGVEWNKVDD